MFGFFFFGFSCPQWILQHRNTLWVVSPLQILPAWSCVFGGESDFIRYRLSFGNHRLLSLDFIFWQRWCCPCVIVLMRTKCSHNKCSSLLPWGGLSSLEKDIGVRSSPEQYNHCKQRIWFAKVLLKNIIISLADCSKDHLLHTDCIHYLHSRWMSY